MLTKTELHAAIDELAGTYVGNAHTDHKVGDVGFLVKIEPRGGRPRYELRPHPVMTAPPFFEPILFGEVDSGNLTIYALGCAEVTHVAANGRAAIEPLWDDDLVEVLEKELAYAELIEEWEDRDD